MEWRTIPCCMLHARTDMKFIWNIIHIISLLTGRYELNKLTSLPMCGFIGRASHRHRYRGGHGFESRWSPDFFRFLLSIAWIGKFTAMIIFHFHLLSQFKMNYFIYTSHHFTPHGKIWTQLIHLAPNVWVHSSVGRVSHRYSRRSRVRIPLKPWFFQASSFNCLNWKIYCDDHSLSKQTIHGKSLRVWFFFCSKTDRKKWSFTKNRAEILAGGSNARLYITITWPSLLVLFHEHLEQILCLTLKERGNFKPNPLFLK